MSALAAALGNAAFSRAVAARPLLARSPDEEMEDAETPPYNFRRKRRRDEDEHVPRHEGTRSYKRRRTVRAGGSRAAVVPPPDAYVPEGNGIFFSGRRSEMRWFDYDGILRDLGSPVEEAGRAMYLCADGARRPRKNAARPGEDYVDVDHRQDWRTYIDMRVSPASAVFTDGHTYEGILLADALEAYNDPRNLQLLGKWANRSKSGPKTIDQGLRMSHDPDDCPLCRRQRHGTDDPGDGPDPMET